MSALSGLPNATPSKMEWWLMVVAAAITSKLFSFNKSINSSNASVT